MKAQYQKIALLTLCLIFLFSLDSWAQGMADDVKGLNKILQGAYDSMMERADMLVGVARVLGASGAFLYIGARIWSHLAQNESIEVFPLLRPFAIGMAIIMFPVTLSVINGFLNPITLATRDMVDGSNANIEALLKQKQEVLKATKKYKWYVEPNGKDAWMTENVDPEADFLDKVGFDIQFSMQRFEYNLRMTIKQWMYEVLRVLYEAAALCINTIRTFFLIVLSMLGPVAFAISIFPGFSQTLTHWLARYINVFLWLPVANVFGSILGFIQEEMIKLDIFQITDGGDTFFTATDTAFLVFMVLGIVGYFTVPTIAGWIITAGSWGGAVRPVNTITSMVAGGAAGMAASGAGTVAGGVGAAATWGAGQAYDGARGLYERLRADSASPQKDENSYNIEKLRG
jgi:conjugative transposon TraJ protein